MPTLKIQSLGNLDSLLPIVINFLLLNLQIQSVHLIIINDVAINPDSPSNLAHHDERSSLLFPKANIKTILAETS